VTDKELDKNAARRLAIIRHAREVTGNVGLTCRYYGISRQVFYRWLRRYEAERPSVIVSGRDLRLTAGARPWPSFAVRLVHAGCTKLDHQRGTGLGHRPVPSHAGQITGVQVCTFPSQVHPRAGTRPPPWHSGHRSLALMIAPIRVASHLWPSPDRRRSLPGAGAVKALVRRTSKMLWPCRGFAHAGACVSTGE
jgi:hypothetical protein